MNLLFIGDIVGQAGREAVKRYLPALVETKKIDLVIANGENAAHGKGLTAKIYRQLKSYGVDVITLGNHAFSNDNIFNFIDEVEDVVRPANMEPLDYGKSSVVVEKKGKRIAVHNLSGEVFMYNITGSPFDYMKQMLASCDADIHVVDFHGEATSEKIAFTYYFAKQLAAVVGTHTHVQTADERLVYGCAAITDLGMCGAYTSVLGRDVEEILTRFTTGAKTRYKIAEGECIFCGAVVQIDDETNRACAIERIRIAPEDIEKTA